ncbi:hypothetical protein K450DRAFT_608 [Umbelopsis ramanniana AG]|uniref:Uncharacterized protein n=1 Tax=Umbelopsis ramanniana AG TaxID=1314678 RepID=A0AAD5EIH7_UMBRA|nr:uncharacterized protein K450DRAFT_608 [Umbelopsis ramanniana AG]KAI8584481.1 hypothetical protein K450DRAFT_608 [Umbelopsis ramanniana AG]
MFKASIAWALLALLWALPAQSQTNPGNDTANGWIVESYAGYNILHNLIAQTSYALVPQGPVFTNITGNVPQIQVPITSAAIDTLDILGFAELLSSNVTSSFTTGSSNILLANTSPCFTMSNNATATYTFANGTSTANNTIVFSANDPSLTPIQKASWLIYLAYFYNEERAAQLTVLNIMSQYNCIKTRVNSGVKEKYAIAWTQADMTTPQVYEIRVDTYAKTLIADAAAKMIAPNSAQDSTYSNVGNFHLALKGADMLLDTSPLSEGELWPQWLSIMNMVPGASLFYESEGYYKNRKVYRADGLVSKTGYSNFPERYAARPDLALMDMIAIQYPTFQNTYNTTWLYNFALGSSPQSFPANYVCNNAYVMLTNQISCYLDEPFTPPATQAAPTNETETDDGGSNSSSGDQSSSLSSGSKAGIAIGVIAGVAALGGAAFWFYRRRPTAEPSHNFYKMDEI